VVIELLLQAEGALSVGLLDRAETIYRQVANADPRNAIAIVGLSRVALERGQQRAALELAQRALTIDRENVAAQRMVQRLEEVLAYRGEAPPAPAGPQPTAGPATPSAGERPAPPSAAESPPSRRSFLDRLRGRH
jgi:tetratricopeptide (TPR) repeat protein